ncbi:MAG: glutaredoxin family protein [bacterium]
MNTKNITIYSTPSCHFCHLAKDFLTEHHIPFTDIDVAADIEKRKEMVEKTGQMGVPVIEVEGYGIMIGFREDLMKEALDIK